MNKQITFLTIILCTLATIKNIAMEGTNKQKTDSTYWNLVTMNVQNIHSGRTKTIELEQRNPDLYDLTNLKSKVSESFNLAPDKFDILFDGEKCPDSLRVDQVRKNLCLLVEKK